MSAISLGLLTLMVSGPFLFPLHTLPLAGFWSEWWAGALGLAAALTGLTTVRGRAVTLPLVLAIPGVLLLALLFQYGLGRSVFPQIGLLYAAYLVWAGLLMILGRHLVEAVGFVRFADVIGGALVLGALIGALIALVQWLGMSMGTEWMFPKLGGSIYGNLGQPNHHAQYSWLGIASAFYLCGRRHLSRTLLWMLFVLIGFGSVISGSRSVFLYPVVLLALLGWSRWRDPDGQAPNLLGDAVLLLPVLAGMSLLAAWVAPHLAGLSGSLGQEQLGGPGAVTAGSRIFGLVAESSTRLEIARSAWFAFLEHPWLGQGAGNYAWGSFVAASSHANDEPFVVANNAHNFILQLLAEFGAPATGTVVLVLGILAAGLLRQTGSLERLWCSAVLGIAAVHALLEYPLWYAYFLGPTALLLGAADSRPGMVLPARRATAYIILFALAGAVILTNLRKDYRTIETVTYIPLAAHPDREKAWRISMDRLLRLHHESLLSPWALLALATMAEPSREQAQDRADLCENGIRFSPARWLITSCAMQLAIAGRETEARRLTLAVLRAYPSQRTATVDELAVGAGKYPEIGPLWAIALGK
ncbi:MAG: Wzy polymerase domain-containing protein [Sulfuritalea sp.]|nr:Wzy polymerase domain-containing protein [Sulfuritalea sp.]